MPIYLLRSYPLLVMEKGPCLHAQYAVSVSEHINLIRRLLYSVLSPLIIVKISCNLSTYF